MGKNVSSSHPDVSQKSDTSSSNELPMLLSIPAWPIRRASNAPYIATHPLEF
jgi:hypothetical protein